MLARGSVDPDGVDARICDLEAPVVLAALSSTDPGSVVWISRFSFSGAMAVRGTGDVLVMGMEGEGTVIGGPAKGVVIEEVNTVGEAVEVPAGVTSARIFEEDAAAVGMPVDESEAELNSGIVGGSAGLVVFLSISS